MAALEIAEARGLWSPETTYLNTASYGLPPRPAWDALQRELENWRGGRTSWEHWGDSTEAARASFGRLLGVAAEQVAIGANVSSFVGLVAASLPDGARVVVPDVEFTSTLFPFLVQEGRGVEVRTVPPSGLADALDERTDLVAFSAVQMSSGELADLAGIAEAARRHGVQTLCDATQAAGWLPLAAGDFDFLVCAGYKWLMAPRGTVFMTVREERLADVVPHAAGWYAGEDVHTSYFGPPLRLAHDARRLDVSPIWFSWVGTAPALEVIERIGVEAIQRHDLALANAFRDGLGMPDEPSAIVVSDFAGDLAQLEAAGVMAAIRGGRLRTSWHVYNTEDDVEAALRAVAS